MEAKAEAKPIKILVVDDQPGMRVTLKGILAKRGYEVMLAEDGNQAIELAKKNSFRVIFMDIQMPGISGVDAFIKIKEIQPNTTVIIMTAFALEDEIKRAVREGAYAVLHKPLDIDLILRVVADSLQDRTLILLVDDRVEDRNLFRTILERKGYKVVDVESGEECIQQVKEQRFQVILLDIKLPGIDGVETLKEVKKVRPDVGVIMVTAYSETQLIEEAMRHGSFAFLNKPFDVKQLIELVNQCLQQEEKK